MENISKEFLKKSRCTSKKEEKLFLLKLLGNKRLVTKLLYCGFIHGWNYKDFHSRCDGKHPTISIFKVKDTGECIGGYTNVEW
jgi:hypothetical protein